MSSSSNESDCSHDGQGEKRRHRKRSSRKKKKQKKKRRYESYYSDDDESQEGDEDKNESNDEKKKEKKRKEKHRQSHKHKQKHKHKHKRKRRRSNDYGNDESESDSLSQSSESDSFSVSASSEYSHRRKKHKSKRRSKSKSRHDEKRRKSSTSSKSNTPHGFSESPPSKYSQVVPQLHKLLSNHPDLATELPYLLIKMCSGSSISLSQIPNPSLSASLGEIFTTLGCTSTVNGGNDFIFDDNGRWTAHSSNTDNDEHALVLIKLLRCILDDNGISMNAIEKFESLSSNKVKDVVFNDDNNSMKMNTEDLQIGKINNLDENEMSSLVVMLLDTFHQPNQMEEEGKESKSSSLMPSLALELQNIMQMILDGEIICLDGLEDDSLRQAIEKLFNIIGLVKEEMEEDSDDEEEDDDDNTNINNNDDKIVGDNQQQQQAQNGNENDIVKKERIEEVQLNDQNNTSFGFTLPSSSTEVADKTKEKLIKSIKATQLYHRNIQNRQQQFEKKQQKRKIMGPSLPSNFVATTNNDNYDTDSEDDDGPAPLGSKRAKARAMETPKSSIPQPTNQNLNECDKMKREEWMMVPGEHNFLKGVMSSGTIKNRKFKNEKNSSSSLSKNTSTSEVPMNPEIKREIDSIMNAHTAARGPSLIEQHREQIAEEKAAAKAAASSNGKKDYNWNWSKKDLDAGRKVDKNYLHMVMGGASKDLKNKFQGSFSSGFT